MRPGIGRWVANRSQSSSSGHRLERIRAASSSPVSARNQAKFISKSRHDHPTPEQNRRESDVHGPGPNAFAGFPERTCPKEMGCVSY